MRVVIGLVVVLFTNVYVKTGMVMLIGQLDSRCFGGRLEALAGTPGECVDAMGNRVPNHKRYYVEVPTKLVNYICLSLMTIWGIPLLWRYFEII